MLFKYISSWAKHEHTWAETKSSYTHHDTDVLGIGNLGLQLFLLSRYPSPSHTVLTLVEQLYNPIFVEIGWFGSKSAFHNSNDLLIIEEISFPINFFFIFWNKKSESVRLGEYGDGARFQTIFVQKSEMFLQLGVQMHCQLTTTHLFTTNYVFFYLDAVL